LCHANRRAPRSFSAHCINFTITRIASHNNVLSLGSWMMVTKDWFGLLPPECGRIVVFSDLGDLTENT
jgi:hypothetical protein